MENTPRNVTLEKAGVADVGVECLGITERKVFHFAAAGAAGDLVVSDPATTTYGLGASAKTAPAGTDDHPTVLGVLEKAVAAGDRGEVVTYGPVNVKANANLDAGDPVCGDTAAAGTVREYVEGTDGNKVGFALEADGAVTAGYARIFVQLK